MLGGACCGIREISGVQSATPEEVVKDIYADRFSMNNQKYAFVIFTCAKT